MTPFLGPAGGTGESNLLCRRRWRRSGSHGWWGGRMGPLWRIAVS